MSTRACLAGVQYWGLKKLPSHQVDLMDLESQLPRLRSLPFKIQGWRCGVHSQWPEGALIIAPSFQLSGDKMEPRRGGVASRRLFHQLEGVRRIKESSTLLYKVILKSRTKLSWMMNSVLTPLHYCLSRLLLGLPLPPPSHSVHGRAEKLQWSWHPQASILSLQEAERDPVFQITNLGFRLVSP